MRSRVSHRWFRAPSAALASVALLLLPSACARAVPAREPAHAGAFYDSDPRALRAFITEALDRVPPATSPPPQAIVVPHAGYQFSGRTAARAYRLLPGPGNKIRRVILMATTHYAGFRGVIVNRRDYVTPLGTCRLDEEGVKAIIDAGLPLAANETAGTREHSDEVQVPFIQVVLPGAKLVPLIVGELSLEEMEQAAAAIAGGVDDFTVLVASSDFTHWGERFGYTPALRPDARAGLKRLDMGAAEHIVAGDTRGFLEYCEETGATICGRNPIALMLEVLARTGWEKPGKVLDYTTSGDLTGDFSGTVSYCAIAMGRMGKAGIPEGEKYLTPEEEKTLLRLARHVLTTFVKQGVENYPDRDLSGFAITQGLKQPLGVFVTLNKSGQLRGCIGHIVPRLPLYVGVIENAINAAARDPRFDRVTTAELKDIHIEISVMSPLMKVGKPEEIVVGRDGVVLTNGPYTGVFLPQVPVEWKWDRKTYLEQLGLKAGLDAEAWKRPNTELLRFTAQVFGE